MPDPPRLRRFRPSDLDAVMAVERASFRRDAYPRDLFLEYAAAGALFLVAEVPGGIAGYALACLRGERAELVSIAVHPSHRRSGAGKALLASVIRRLRRAGARRLTLTVKVTNRNAIRFYAGFGFRRLRRAPRYYEDGRDGWLMARDN